MLLQKLFSLLLLALQTYLVASRVASRYDESAVLNLSDETNHLLRRAAIKIDKDEDRMVISGTRADTLLSYGHDSCPGLAAVGTPATANGIDKVVGHILIEGTKGVDLYTERWLSAVRASGMTNIKVVVYERDPEADPTTSVVQTDVNNKVRAAAHSIQGATVSIVIRWQEDLPSPQDQLFVEKDGTILVGTVPVH